jgi:hypothetical protein
MVGVNVRNAHVASEEHLRDREREGRELKKELRDAGSAGDQTTVEEIENDPEKARILSEHEVWADYLTELRRIDHDIKDVQLAHNISNEDRRAYLESLRSARKELLRQSDEAAKEMAGAHQ